MVSLTLDFSLDIDSKPRTEKEAWTLHLRNKWWRLNNLYWIKDKEGKKVKFRPNENQKKFLQEAHGRDIILKARQLGFTTLIQIWMLDECMFEPNTNAGVVAHNRDDAIKFFKDKIKYAYDALVPYVKARFPATNDAANELRFENGSAISVGTSLRSGTYQILHISEYGKLCAQWPEKAKEVRTGAMETVPINGWQVIESTAEGKIGDFYRRCDVSIKRAIHPGELGALEEKFHFMPWYDDPKYSLDETPKLTVDDVHYFRDLEEKGITLTDGQKAWYVSKQASLQDEMKREYPSTPDEAFQASVDGAYFAKQMSYLRNTGRLCRIPIDRAIPIHTFWDLGRDTTAIWFFQQVGFDYRFINYYEHSGEGMDFYLDVLRSMNDEGWPYLYGDMYLPHDGTRKSLMSLQGQPASPADMLYEARYNVRLVTRTPDKNVSINQARRVLPQCYFDIDRCAKGITHLESYRKERIPGTEAWRPLPVHDESSHGCLVAGEQIETPEGYKNIEDFSIGDKVKLGDVEAIVSHSGYVKTCKTLEVELSNGVLIECSPEHKFFTTRGVVPADALVYNDIVSTKEEPLCDIQNLCRLSGGLREEFTRFITESNIGIGPSENYMYLRLAVSKLCYIAYSGLTVMAQFLKSTTSFQKMAIGATSIPTIGAPELATLEFAVSAHIQCRNSMVTDITKGQTDISSPVAGHINTCTELYGNITMEKFPKNTMCTISTKTSQTTALKTLRLWLTQIIQNFTPLKTNGLAAKTTKNNCAKPGNLQKNGTPHPKVGSGIKSMAKLLGRLVKSSRQIAKSAAVNTKPIGQIEAYFARTSAVSVVAVRETGKSKPVYDITVEKHHAYFVNGVLTSNSDAFMSFSDGYALVQEIEEDDGARSASRTRERNQTTGY